jgi:hypothetical protein
MKRLAPLALALALSSCALPGTLGAITLPVAGNPTVAAVGDKVVVTGTQGLILANLAYQTLAEPIAVAMERGVITGTKKQQIKVLSARITALLQKGKEAQDSAVKAKAAADAMGLVQAVADLSGISLPKF